MSEFKCKMCGGTLRVESGESVGICEYCGTKQTLPKLGDESRANLYDRANHFRRKNEYDKAMGIYEQILNEDSTDAEAYWSIVLCRYGIEYVEDPATHKRVPTVNRAQFTSIFADEDYKSAIEYADYAQRELYEQEAKAIDEIQKGILAISQKEEPFDVFICYKETDASGRRTQDSVLATDLYHQLKQEGFKVFFSRITLEDKLGQEYEPYIFAALNSAKVMVVLGTKPEYFNAVWVKNEWSRYLSLIKNGAKKVLIPAYKDMDPYDLPEEFSHLQAQDMSKLGFMQDIIRGIKKITSAEKPKAAETVVVSGAGGVNVDPLIERAFIFLEDKNWKSADEYCEKVLDMKPENAEAYLGKLMAELHVSERSELAKQATSFENNANYKKVIRFANYELLNEVSGYVAQIGTRNENARMEGIYNGAVKVLRGATTEFECRKAAEEFGSISGYKNSARLYKECIDKANRIKIESEHKAEEARIAADIQKKKTEKTLKIALPIVAVVIALIIIFTTVIKPSSEYDSAVALMNSGKYNAAISAFEDLGGYKDSETMILECRYRIACNTMDDGNYEKAIQLFGELGEYKDSKKLIEECDNEIKEEKYQKAVSYKDKKEYEKAIEIFSGIKGYKDSSEQINICKELYNEERYQKGLDLFKAGKLSEAKAVFKDIKGYKDSAEQIKTIEKEEKYQKAVGLMEKGKYKEARDIFKQIQGYKDSDKKLNTCNNKINGSSSSSSGGSSSSSAFKVEQSSYKNVQGRVEKKYRLTCKNCGSYHHVTVDFGSSKNSVTQTVKCPQCLKKGTITFR